MEGILDLTGCGAAVRERYLSQLVISVQIGSCEKDIDAVNRLAVRGILTEREVHSSRKRLVKKTERLYQILTA